MKIGVVGLGLIGGSIFKSLMAKGYDVVGISSSQSENPNYCNIFSEKENLSDCKLIFVCAPINKIIKELKELEQYVSPDTIVTDVASLKEFVSKEKFNYNFIPSHPMAGTEFSGFENSFADLFQGAKWVITAEKETVPTILLNTIKNMGAEIIITTPKEHDEAAALISHMPMVLAQALFQSIDDNNLAKKIASSGFRDMTRLALSSEEMACDMVRMNPDNIQKALLKLYSNIGELIKEDYRQKIHIIKKERNNMYKDGKNVYPIEEL